MLTFPPRGPAPDRGPLTHRDCLAGSSPPVHGTAAKARTFVQVRRWHPDGAVTLCGTVEELHHGEDGREWFKVQTAAGRVWTEARHVRLCSGDGRCTCEPSTSDADEGSK